MARLVKKVFSRDSPDFQNQALMPGLPDEYLEEEVDVSRDEDAVPRTLLIVLKSLRVFGHVDHKIFVELMKSIEYITLKGHDSLFKVGESDENMYIVDSGCINVFSTSKDPRTGEIQTSILKRVHQGEALFSLLSFIEYLGGRHKMYKTVSAKATEETRVIKFSFQSFKASFDKYPENLAKVIQVVMVRLQRVTLLALHQYLGLGAELLTPVNRGGTAGQVMKRQSSQRQHELENLLKKHVSNPEPEATSPMSDSTGEEQQVLLFSPMIIAHKKEIEGMNHEQMKRISLEAFQEVLHLTDEQLIDMESPMEDHIYINEPDEGDILVTEDSNDSPSLILILNGSVELTQKNSETSEATKIHRAYVGGILCQLQTLTNEPSFFTVKALTKETKVARLDSKYVRDAIFLYPHVSLRLAMSVIDNLSPYVRSIDFALEWLQVESGKALYKQNDEADSTYVVLSGRLRSVIRQENNKKTIVAEYGRGDLTGIVETLLNTTRKTTVMAVRDSEVAKVPKQTNLVAF
jgi:lysophospholipid hydrolase